MQTEDLDKCAVHGCKAMTTVGVCGVRAGEVYGLHYCDKHWNWIKLDRFKPKVKRRVHQKKDRPAELA